MPLLCVGLFLGGLLLAAWLIGAVGGVIRRASTGATVEALWVVVVFVVVVFILVGAVLFDEV